MINQIIFRLTWISNSYLDYKNRPDEGLNALPLTAPTQKAGFRLRMNIEK